MPRVRGPTKGGIIMAHRSISQQLQHAVRDNITLGHSKHAERAMGVRNRVYSIQNSENMMNTAKQFGKWMSENHPEVRWAKEISNKHVSQYIESKQGQWNVTTQYSKASQIAQLGRLVNETYHAHIDLKVDVCRPTFDQNIRNVAIAHNDIIQIKNALSPDSNGRTAVEISSRTGLRIKEIAHLRAERINLERKVIEVREGAKNGKYRDIPIRDKDIAYFRELRDRIGSGYVTHGVQDDSLNRAIRRAMERINISEKYRLTTNHAIRKSYARERYQEELDKGLNNRQAWSTVQGELGHGTQFREKLFEAYIGK